MELRFFKSHDEFNQKQQKRTKPTKEPDKHPKTSKAESFRY